MKEETAVLRISKQFTRRNKKQQINRQWLELLNPIDLLSVDSKKIKIILKMQIKGNEYLIDNITEMIKNGSNKNANTFDKCIEIYLEEGRRYNSNNASIEKRRATTGNDGIHHSEQGQYRWTNGNEKNVRNRGQSTTNYSKSSIVDNRQAARDIGQNELMMEI